MRICYAGPVWKTGPDETRPEYGYDGSHGANAIGTEMVQEWNRLGHEARHWNFWKTTERGVPTHEAYDAVFLYDQSMIPLWQQQVPGWDPRRQLTMVWLHAASDGYLAIKEAKDYARRNCQLVCFTHDTLTDWFLREWPHQGAFTMRWAASGNWTWPPKLPNPYDRRPVGIWAARLFADGRNVRVLAEVLKRVPQLELHIVSNSVEEKAITAEQIAEMLPGAVFHGSMKHGTFNHLLYYADVALDVMVYPPPQHHANCKTYDYVAAGVPVVMEGPVPGDEPVRETGNGLIVDFDDLDAYIQNIRSVISTTWNRTGVRDYMKETHTWAHRAQTVHGWIERWQGQRWLPPVA